MFAESTKQELKKQLSHIPTVGTKYYWESGNNL